jgi:hypothetical protein
MTLPIIKYESLDKAYPDPENGFAPRTGPNEFVTTGRPALLVIPSAQTFEVREYNNLVIDGKVYKYCVIAWFVEGKRIILAYSNSLDDMSEVLDLIMTKAKGADSDIPKCQGPHSNDGNSQPTHG